NDNRIEFTKELSWTNNADPQEGEGAQKAESDLTFEPSEVPVRTIAHIIKASKQAIDDQPVLAEFVERRMLHGVAMAEEDQLINGDGTGYNSSGLINDATAYNKAATGDNYLDTLRRAVLQ